MVAKRKELTFAEAMVRLKRAGLENSLPPNRTNFNPGEIASIEERVAILFDIVNKERNPANMLYFVMYDIEDNRVRVQISKYLIKKGCQRIQKSIFLANTDRLTFDEIHQDLKMVQECYNNNDSILLIPISTDEIRAMKMIGQNIDMDITLRNKNTLFF